MGLRLTRPRLIVEDTAYIRPVPMAPSLHEYLTREARTRTNFEWYAHDSEAAVPDHDAAVRREDP